MTDPKSKANELIEKYRKFIRETKVMFLRMELATNPFTIGGYNDCMVRVMGRRFLNHWEVTQVIKWRNEGRLIVFGESRVTSTATGREYVDTLYVYKK